MCALIEDLLPPSYFSSTLLGIQTDQRVLRQLIVQYLPALDRLLQEHDIGKNEAIPLPEGEKRESLQCIFGGSLESVHIIKSFCLLSSELSLITLHWFLTSFASVVDIRLLLRIWDLLFYQGSLVLFQITLGMLKIQVNPQRSFAMHRDDDNDEDRFSDCFHVAIQPQEEELILSENSASIFNTLSDLPSQLRDGAVLLGEAMRLAGTLSQETLEAQRHKHLAYILSEQAQLNNGNSVPLNANLNKVSQLWA